MFFFVDIPLIFLSVIFLTRTNIHTSQQFINRLHAKRMLIFPWNSTARKNLHGNHHLFNLSLTTKFSRKRRQTNADFKKDSLKYFTCSKGHRNKSRDTPAFIPCIFTLIIVLILVESVRFLAIRWPAYENHSLFPEQSDSEATTPDD